MGWPRILRWRYSLRALFVFIALFMIWGGYHANRGWKQRWAEKTLREKYGATFSYDLESYQKQSLVTAYYRLYVHRLWGERIIGSAHLTAQFEPEVVDALKALPGLRMLAIGPPGITRQENDQTLRTGVPAKVIMATRGGLARVLDHQELRVLRLGGWEFHADDWNAIASERTVHAVFFGGMEVPEGNLVEVAKLPNLHTIELMCCRVTGAGLDSVRGSTALEYVVLDDVPVTAEFARYLARCPNLKSLCLKGQSFNDEFIAAIGPHPSLREIALVGPITDATADSLAQMPSLEKFGHVSGALSDGARGRLKRAIPDLILNPP